MQRRSLRSFLKTKVLVLSASFLLASLTIAANPQSAKALPSDVLAADVLAANQEIDRQFLEAHRVPNVDKIMGLFTSSPEIFFIGPTGILYRGREQVRQSIEKFFDRVSSMTGVIDHVTYLPAGDGVIAYGQVTYHRQFKSGATDERVVVWSDYRHKENGKWVLVFRHAHWPLASNSLPAAATR